MKWNSTSYDYPLPDYFTAEIWPKPEDTKLELCGLPAFCSSSALQACRNVTLKSCEQCSMAGGVVYVLVVVLLAIVVLLSNGFVLSHLWWSALRKSGQKPVSSTMKLSMAVADLMTGVNLLVVIPFGFAWTMNSRPFELKHDVNLLRAAPVSKVGGIFFLLTFTSSLYHLILIGLQQLRAIRAHQPYEEQKRKNVMVEIGAVWLVALLTATSPVWFSHLFTFTYSHTTFLYTLDFTRTSEYPNNISYIVFIAVIFLLPFAVMIFITITTALVICCGVWGKRRRFSNTQTERPADDEYHTNANYNFVTMILMQVGYTITLTPVFLVMLLRYIGAQDCKQLSSPLLVCFLFGMLHSLVNFVTYSVREKDFRRSAHKTLASFLPCIKTPSKTPSDTAQSSRNDSLP